MSPRKLGKARQHEVGGEDDYYFNSSGQEGLDKKVTFEQMFKRRAEVHFILR